VPDHDSEVNDLFGLGFGTGAGSKPEVKPASRVGTGRGSAVVAPRTGRTGAAGPSAPTTHTRVDVEQTYLAELQRAIARYQHFPDEARRDRRSGVVAISFVVQADGRIQQVAIARSSGDPILDQAAMNALGQLGRFKPIPAEIGRHRWPIRVPIRFDLR
jgi:protein TonB